MKRLDLPGMFTMQMPEWSKVKKSQAAENIKKGVLLIHGFTGSPHEFAPILPALRELGYIAETVTLPGHGDEPDIDIHATTAEAMLAHCVNEAEAMAQKVDAVYLVGHSLGGAFALLTAAQHPPKLAGVMAYSAPYQHAYFYNHPIGLTKMDFGTLLRSIRFAPADRLKCRRPRFKPWSVPRLLTDSRQIFAWMQAEVSKVNVPVHLAHSRYDLVVPYVEMAKIAEAIPGPVETLTLEHSGHRIFPTSRDKDLALEPLFSLLAHAAPDSLLAASS
jgi:esterase/lipase